MELDGFVLAIDGPGGSGKTTVARSVAMKLGLPHLDTGAYYRSATVAVWRAGVDVDDVASVTEVVSQATFSYERGRMFLNGLDVSEAIRSEETTSAVSAVSAIAEVRSRLVDEQRRWVAERGGSAVVEGRDIASVVFPDAALKIFITARPEVRARRRAGEVAGDHAAIQADLQRRDKFDSTRDVAPLQRSEAAIEIDTSDLSIDEVIARVLRLAESHT